MVAAGLVAAWSTVTVSEAACDRAVGAAVGVAVDVLLSELLPQPTSPIDRQRATAKAALIVNF
jgi:hypothetical protein